jgi:hypothetical protein
MKKRDIGQPLIPGEGRSPSRRFGGQNQCRRAQDRDVVQTISI